MPFLVRPVVLLAAALALTGCASLARERGYADTRHLLEMRRGVAPPASWADVETRTDVPSEPISADDAVRLAFFNNPRIREEFARLGLGRAELEEARRINNPTFGYTRLSLRDADSQQITRSVTLGLTDLLLLPARKRFAEGNLERLQKAVAGALLDLASEVEAAWYEAVSAQQVAAMRDLVAMAAETSAEMAQRFLDAGNITRLQQAQERAASATARIGAVRAGAEATRARLRLAGLMGLPGTGNWRTQSALPAPLVQPLSADALLPLALENRLDLAAARQTVDLREDALGVTRRWRWFGNVEVGAERETELDGGVLRGPSLALELPLFDQGQGAIARAEAELLQARAELDALSLRVRNDAQLGVDALAAMADISERYRLELVPQREAIVAESQKEVNFMLIGVFELLFAKQQEYDAYQEYLEAVRDYWTTRAELRRVVGGRLPDDDAPRKPAIGVDAILPDPNQEMKGMDHSAHGAMDSDARPDGVATSGGSAMAAPAAVSPDGAHGGHAQTAMPAVAPQAPRERLNDADDQTSATHQHHGDLP